MQRLRVTNPFACNAFHPNRNVDETGVTCLSTQSIAWYHGRRHGVLAISSHKQSSDEEREIEAVLSSESFSEAPSLARLLKYLCSYHLSGDKNSLNEYRIGAEALGRPSDFDPATNSSVRVEMHRLRARLRKYYATEGADHALRITLAEGRYGLQFVERDGGPGAAHSEAEELRGPSEKPGNWFTRRRHPAGTQPPTSNPDKGPESGRFPHASPIGLTIVATVLVALLVAIWMLVGARSRGGVAHTLTAPYAAAVGDETAPTAATTGDRSVLILAGALNVKYVDRDGNVWVGDRYFTGGQAVAESLPFIQGTQDPTIYHSARVGDFSYDIPVKPGMYELRLHFVESTFGPGTRTGRGESSRVFSVLLGGKPLLTDFDILSDVGGSYRAFERVFKGVSPGGDGMVHLKFLRGFDQPTVNAIELAAEAAGRMKPVRIVMQPNSYVDHAGRLWGADQYAIGGVLETHTNPAVNAPESHLFDGERFGHFSYQIPVAAGRYTVTLYFTEAYYGTDIPEPGHGGRLFDVYANGVALLRGFSIYEKAGGPDKPITETFHGIEPNAAGLIVLNFVPVSNYALLNAIEVTDESQ